jgi:nitroimidazol reductase NimA-like FMN-containing flavoprotein (pyridoxamine 5'-phosphate oxidase superfamily)
MNEFWTLFQGQHPIILATPFLWMETMTDTASPATAAAAPTDRTRVRRGANNAVYDAATLYAIIDDAYLCHVAFSDGKGVHCIPMACWREGGNLYIHGSNGSRMVKRLLESDACVTITHLDGLVMARSAFSHSMNYRSAMIYGRFEQVGEDAAKRHALEHFMESLAPGRQAEVRAGNDKEYAATTVLRIGLAEAACKVREGRPTDDEEDMSWPVWAGVVPFERTRLAPIPDPDCALPVPQHIKDLY